ncbi:NCS2 family permease [Haloferax profundi]|uniref:Uracil permease n=1 Tax=Haloferax profundi TaxID=1544718 RepID=A0A0W1STL3_9EURY|nr:NCS2 family permease [Haloferax profundi]KTG29590.1 uracil permease [Haloferax profundi]
MQHVDESVGLADVADSLGSYFDFEAHDTTLRTEVLAGLTTFLTMSYIVVANPAILAGVAGAKPGIVLPGYEVGTVQQMLAVVTILSAAIGTLVMALYAKRPFAQAPGMGINAVFAFTAVGALGIPWQTALAAVFVEGVLFVALTALGARKYILRLFPEPVKLSVGTGLGLFLAIIGLQEMRVVVDDPATLVGLGNVASDPIAILSVVGLFLTFGLYARGTRGAIVLGILGTTALGWAVTQLGLVGVDAGLVVAAATTSVSLPVVGAFDLVVPGAAAGATYDISPIAGSFVGGFSRIDPVSFALVVFVLFFVDFFNTAGALTGVGQAAGFLDEDGDLPEVERPLMADAVATTAGGALGTSPVTTYIESATGVQEGGRTGMTALVVALLFLVAIPLVPLVAAIPLFASHIAVVVIGVVMLQNVVDIDFDDTASLVPAGLTMLVMPFTYSIAYGIAAGIVSYPLVKVAVGDAEDLRPGHWALAAAFVAYFVVRSGGLS